MFLGNTNAPLYDARDLILPCVSSGEHEMLTHLGDAVAAQAVMFDSLYFLLGSRLQVETARRRDNAINELLQSAPLDILAINELQETGDISFTVELSSNKGQRLGWERNIEALARALNDNRHRQSNDPNTIIQFHHIPVMDTPRHRMQMDHWQLFVEAVLAHEWLNFCDEQGGDSPLAAEPDIYRLGKHRVSANARELAHYYRDLQHRSDSNFNLLALVDHDAHMRWLENIHHAAMKLAAKRAEHAS